MYNFSGDEQNATNVPGKFTKFSKNIIIIFDFRIQAKTVTAQLLSLLYE